MALVIFSGVASVRSNCGTWTEIGQRLSVFEGLPYALYLPPGTEFTLEARNEKASFKISDVNGAL